MVPEIVDGHEQLKIRKGSWLSGKRKQWLETMTEEETEIQKRKYNEMLDRKLTLTQDIEKIELTMKELVSQQLGDKASREI
mmetsp:Transcript_17854/g.30304  ORF Transcript_17854/g.30304 Transcript_17854/m.30304 type:complete len:81 (+) Transcript_17854:1016-1258(+)